MRGEGVPIGRVIILALFFGLSLQPFLDAQSAAKRTFERI